MGKKEKMYTLLSDMDHKLQYVNIVAVINEITPKIRRDNWVNIDLNLSDSKMHNPGFLVRLNMDHELLNQFLDVSKRGFIVELLEIKVIKNEGLVYGEVRDEEEIKLYNESGAPVKWYTDEKSSSVSDQLRSVIKNLLVWKKSHFMDSLDIPLSTDTTHSTTKSRMKSLQSGKGSLDKTRLSSASRITPPQKVSENVKDQSSNKSSNKKTLFSPQRQVESQNNKKSFSKNEDRKSKEAEIYTPRLYKIRTSKSNDIELRQPNTLSKQSPVSDKNKHITDSSKKSLINKSLVDNVVTNDSLGRKELQGKVLRNTQQVKQSKEDSPKKLTGKKIIDSVKKNLTIESKIKLLQPKKSLEHLTQTDSPISETKVRKFDNSRSTRSKSPLIGKECSAKEQRITNQKMSTLRLKNDEDKNKDITNKKSVLNNSLNVNKGKETIHRKRGSSSKVVLFDENVSLPKRTRSNSPLKKNKTVFRSSLPISKTGILKLSPYVSDSSRESSPVTQRTIKINPMLNSSDSSDTNSDLNISQRKQTKKVEEKEIRNTNYSPKKLNVPHKNNNNEVDNNLGTPSLKRIKRNTRLSEKVEISGKTKLINKTVENDCLSQSRNSKVTSQGLKYTKEDKQIVDKPTDQSIQILEGIKSTEKKTQTKMLSTSKKTKGEREHPTDSFKENKRFKSAISENHGAIEEKEKVVDALTDQSIQILEEIKLTPKKTETIMFSPSKKTKGKREHPNESFTEIERFISAISETHGAIEEKELPVIELQNSLSIIDSFSKIDNPLESKKTTRGSLNNKNELSPQNENKGKVRTSRNSQQITRGSLNNKNEPSTQLKKPSVEKNYFFNHLKSLTRKVHFIEAESIFDTSMCNLEDIEMADKFDLTCKVISQFTLLEEGIQVVRVQDGSIFKRGTLFVPQRPTWKEVTEEIERNLIVLRNSPFVDIIIFDYTRMEDFILQNSYYVMRNIMSVKLNVKSDPRKEKPGGEFFFCVEGKDICLRRLSKNKKIAEKLEAEAYMNAWTKIMYVDIPEVLNSIKNLRDLPMRSAKNDKEIGSSNVISSDNDKPKVVASAVNRKRKHSDSQLDKKSDSPKLQKEFEEPEADNTLCRQNDKTTLRTRDLDNKDMEDKNSGLEPKADMTVSSDETLFGETPAIIRELSEIMHEESVLGLPLTLTEDVHLKNSGSEVTFSQFCKGAKSKAQNFRISTQIDDLSESIVPLGEKDSVFGEESNKMEPLVYCPSSSSLSSAIDGQPTMTTKLLEKSVIQEECSESVLQNYQSRTHSEVKAKSCQPNTTNIIQKRSKDSEDNASNNSCSSSVKVISSNSSELDYEVVESDKCGNTNHLSNGKTVQPTHNKTDTKQQTLLSLKETMPLKCKNKSVNNEANISLHLPPSNQEDPINGKCSNINDNEVIRHEQIDVVSDNSSNDSLVTLKNNRGSIEPDNTSFPDIVDPQIYRSDQFKIPERCFFKSTTRPVLPEDASNTTHDDDYGFAKFFSYSFDKHLPFVTLDILEEIGQTNCVCVMVTFESITPALKDSWQENSIKSRCPTCSKLYDVYNASNNKYKDSLGVTSAISAGCHIVCPDSQCCNQILDNPEFYFTAECKLKDGSPVRALIGANHAEEIFGCTAQEAVRNENQLKKVTEILQRITKAISDRELIKVNFTRVNVCDINSGPLYIQKLHL